MLFLMIAASARVEQPRRSDGTRECIGAMMATMREVELLIRVPPRLMMKPQRTAQRISVAARRMTNHIGAVNARLVIYCLISLCGAVTLSIAFKTLYGIVLKL
jgi:hypothetical protein